MVSRICNKRDSYKISRASVETIEMLKVCVSVLKREETNDETIDDVRCQFTMKTYSSFMWNTQNNRGELNDTHTSDLLARGDGEERGREQMI